MDSPSGGPDDRFCQLPAKNGWEKSPSGLFVKVAKSRIYRIPLRGTPFLPGPADPTSRRIGTQIAILPT